MKEMQTKREKGIVDKENKQIRSMLREERDKITSRRQ